MALLPNTRACPIVLPFNNSIKGDYAIVVEPKAEGENISPKIGVIKI